MVLDKLKEQSECTLCVFFIAGLLVLLFIAFAVTGAFNLPENAGGWVYEYQTLLAGVIAAASLWITWQNYKHQSNKKALYARARMNDALASICDYAEECFLAVKNDNKNELPEKRLEAISILTSSIEFLDSDTSQAVFELVSFYQVHNSRLNSYFSPANQIVRLGSREDKLYDSVLLHHYAARLFAYARNQTNSFTAKKPTLTEMSSSLNSVYGITRQLMAYNDPRLKGLIKKIEQYHQ